MTLRVDEETMHSGHYSQTLDTPKRLKRICNRTIRNLKKAIASGSVPDFDAVACTGVSGMLIAPSIAMRLGVQLIVVRKTLGATHATELAEGEPIRSYRYLLVDDFSCTGATIRNVDEKLHGTHVGSWFYSGHTEGFYPNRKLDKP